MEFEIRFYKDDKGNSPIEEFLLELEKSNLLEITRKRLNELRRIES